jgi:transcriptional regulator with GAF, ATPase, and Fis domain
MMMPVRMVLDAFLRSITVQMRQEIPFAVVRTLADAERAHIITTLRETNWVVGGRNGAAAILGLNRTTLVARMRKLGISREKAEQSTGRSDTGAKAPLDRLSVPA